MRSVTSYEGCDGYKIYATYGRNIERVIAYKVYDDTGDIASVTHAPYSGRAIIVCKETAERIRAWLENLPNPPDRVQLIDA